MPNLFLKLKIFKKPGNSLTEEEFLKLMKEPGFDSNLILKYDSLRKKSSVLNAMLDYDKLCYKHFAKEAFTFDIVNKIVKLNTGYYLDETDIMPKSIAYEKLIHELISLYPQLIVSLKKISNYISILALESGYIPHIDDLLKNPELRKYKLIISKGFEKDPKFIRFFSPEMITQNVIVSLKKRRYILSEDDLKINKYLCDNPDLMYNAIKNNPRLIIYISKNCFFPPKIFEFIDSKYLITVDDIKNHPEIVKNYSLIQAIPRLLIYSDFITYNQKLNIIKELLNIKQNFNGDNVPFLENQREPINLNLLNKLIKKINEFKYEKNEENNFLNEIINQITYLRYEKSKNKFLFQDIVKLNDFINKSFENNNLATLIKNIVDFTNNKLNIEFISLIINKFYLEFQKNNYIGLEETSEFCNNVLNIHRNNFINEERKKIKEEIKKQLSLSLKKENSIKIRYKLKIIKKYIVQKRYELLGISKENLEQELYELKKQLENNKKIKKEKISFENFYKIINHFVKNGSITDDEVSKFLNFKNNKISHFMAKKINNIRLKYINYVEIDSIDYSKIKKDLALNSSNFMLLSKERFLINLSNVIINFNDDEIKKFLSISDKSFLIYCLYFLNLIDDFSIKDYLNIISTYNQITEKLNISDINVSNLCFVIFLSNCYSNKNNLSNFIFNENIIKALNFGINDYLEFYKYIFYLNESNIPPINVAIGDKLFLSGEHDNPDRLLIGKGNNFCSCIDLLDSSGCDTYKEVLSKPNGDVILIYKNDKLVGRILVFRRGNVIQLITSFNQQFPIYFFLLIAENIKNKIKDDNIDFILVNKGSVIEENCNIKLIKDVNLNKLFPHADKIPCAYVLYETNKKIDYTAPIIGKYQRLRKNVAYKPSSDEITRLRVLDILLEMNLDVRKNKYRKFEPFVKEDYKVWISGEDWYLAITNTNKIEELILPSATNESYIEIENAKENIIEKTKFLYCNFY